MKNLKKVLAFALVVCMMLSTVVSATAISATEFTDYSTIQNADAVAVLTELGVINGYPTGDYKPAKTVSRAEMAKMITVILNKGTDAAGNYEGVQVFSDVYNDMWCKGYVNYCNTLGIVVGMGDGTYKPNQGVTVAQTAKMLLVAMGYDPVVEGFEGANWEVNVNSIAAKAGLYNGVAANASAECSRDTAALVIYNALVANTVEGYVNGTAVVGEKTMMGMYFNAVVVTGAVVANDYANLFGADPLYNAKYAATELAILGAQYVDDDDAIDPGVAKVLGFRGNAYEADNARFTKSYVSGYGDNDYYQSQIFQIGTTLDQVGQTVKVVAKLKDNYEYYYKNAVRYSEYTFTGEVIGKVMEVDCVVKEIDGDYYEFKTADLKKEGVVLDSTTRYFINYATSWESFGLPERYGDYEGNAKNYYGYGLYVPTITSADEHDNIGFNPAGAYTKFIDADGDGIVEFVIQWRPFFAVAEYDSYYKTYTFDSRTMSDLADEGIEADWYDSNWDSDTYANIDADDVISEDEIKDGDKVLVVHVDGKYYVELCESEVVTVHTVSIDTEDNDYVKDDDGTTYYESGLYWAYNTYRNSDAFKLATRDEENKLHWDLSLCKTDADYKFYYDSYGNVVAYEEDKGPPSDGYAMVTASYIYGNSGSADDDYYLYLTKTGESKTNYVEVQWHGTRNSYVCEGAEPFFSTHDVFGDWLNLSYVNAFYNYNSYRYNVSVTHGYNMFDPYMDDIQGAYSLGDFTALIKAEYDDDEDVCVDTPDKEVINLLYDASGNLIGNNLSVKADKYEYQGSGFVSPTGTNTGARSKNYYTDSDTIFFIYQYSVSPSGVVTVEDRFSVIGDQNLPTINFNDTTADITTCDLYDNGSVSTDFGYLAAPVNYTCTCNEFLTGNLTAEQYAAAVNAGGICAGCVAYNAAYAAAKEELAARKDTMDTAQTTYDTEYAADPTSQATADALVAWNAAIDAYDAVNDEVSSLDLPCACDHNLSATGITAMYGVANGDGTLQAVVIETNAEITKVINNYVFVYAYKDVTGSYKKGDTTYRVYGVNQDGEEVELYVDAYTSDLIVNGALQYGVYAVDAYGKGYDDLYTLTYTSNYSFKYAAQVTNFDYTQSYISVSGTRYKYATDAKYYLNTAVRYSATSTTNYLLAPTTKKGIAKFADGNAAIIFDSNNNIVVVIGGYSDPIVFAKADPGANNYVTSDLDYFVLRDSTAAGDYKYMSKEAQAWFASRVLNWN